jgi:hypothetical protein
MSRSRRRQKLLQETETCRQKKADAEKDFEHKRVGTGEG